MSSSTSTINNDCCLGQHRNGDNCNLESDPDPARRFCAPIHRAARPYSRNGGSHRNTGRQWQADYCADPYYSSRPAKAGSLGSLGCHGGGGLVIASEERHFELSRQANPRRWPCITFRSVLTAIRTSDRPSVSPTDVDRACLMMTMNSVMSSVNSHECQVAVAVGAAGWVEPGNLEDIIRGTGLRCEDGKYVP